MALVVYPDDGYDSFISLDEANSWISTHSPHAYKWYELDDDTKEIYLRLHCQTIQDKIDITLLSDHINECVQYSNASMALNDVVYGITLNTNPNFGLVTKEKVGDVEIDYKQYVQNLNKPSLYTTFVKNCLRLYGATFNTGCQILLGKS